jgi:microcystin-dependent protein
MDQPLIGMIWWFAGNFPPLNYAVCDGQLLSISSNAALFSILGTTYGGNGVNTFALPDLRSRISPGWGQGPGLANVNLGDIGGTETATLTTSTMPSHTHAFEAVNLTSGKNFPGPSHAIGYSPVDKMYSLDAVNTNLSPVSIQVAGGGTPFSIMQPVLGLTACIALNGVFPSRN